ncbi:hypothetical protein DAEQUDRAFT_807306 [Daedalea quercina L-15889]|uniref:Homeobox domain-containing protein n=1 Tax=Daedalea quercina L-15889 TaxID=1314783 RepID=A0A165UKE1_9APHY|nr:hypothetical protein DAEQUDRAFT_807306 [Daedalea quercina L-15889]
MPRTTRSQAAALPAPGQSHDIPVPQAANENVENVFVVETMKEKKSRLRITQSQLERLDALYNENTHPSRQVKQSLANELSLPLKNITIWFQNKRQMTRRKSSRFTSREGLEEVPGPRECGPSTKILLGLTSDPASSREDTPSPDAKQGSPIKDRSDTPASVRVLQAAGKPSAAASRPGGFHVQDLWNYYPASPLTPTLVNSSVDSVSPSMLLPEDDVFGPVIASAQGPRFFTGRKPDLEWACAREEERSRILTSACRSPDLSSGLKGVLDAGAQSDQGQQVRSPALLGPQPRGEVQDLKDQAFCTDVSIPAEYYALFPVDMIEGASLLLNLKYTAVRP